MRYLGSLDEAEDAVQVAAIKIYLSGHTFRGESKPETWFHSILVNTCLNMLAHISSDICVSRIEQSECIEPIDECTPEATYAAKARSLELCAAIDGMPPNMRKTWELREYELLTYEEIAKKLGVRVGTVRSRLFRAREFLEKCAGHNSGAPPMYGL